MGVSNTLPKLGQASQDAKSRPFPYVKYSKLSHMTYFRLNFLIVISYCLSYCLPLFIVSYSLNCIRWILVYFYCFVHRVKLKIYRKIPTKCAISTWKCKKKFWDIAPSQTPSPVWRGTSPPHIPLPCAKLVHPRFLFSNIN